MIRSLTPNESDGTCCCPHLFYLAIKRFPRLRFRVQSPTLHQPRHSFDAQVSKKISSIKSIVKIGGTNIGNKLYTTGWGNPSVGGMYYVSIMFDELLN